MSHPVDEILRAQKSGESRGLPSICSAHPWVLKTALRGEFPVLIESTCNQVNQFGGYTGMTPADFAVFVRGRAAENGFPPERLLLGGDHLGPSPWQDEPAEFAMPRAIEMVQAYVRAGFTKLHLDTSMRLGGDDPTRPLDQELAASRAAILARAAEDVSHSTILGNKTGEKDLRYVIGTEVPIPGGATEHENQVPVTTVEDAQRTYEVTHAAFVEAGLESAWQRVVAMVVQPGVEFGDDFILDYDPKAAHHLAHFSETLPLVYEVHSTDYQTRDSLCSLVRDHFAILKVGPALTFAFRETLFALAMMENEMVTPLKRSHLIETLDITMKRKPIHWRKYYRGSKEEQAYARKYSLSDRIRYYWSEPEVQVALGRLMKNLGAVPLPLSLIGQFLPDLYPLIRAGDMPNSATDIILGRISRQLERYSFAGGNAIS